MSRSSVVEGGGTLGADELAHRVAALEIAGRYERFIGRYEDYPSATLTELPPDLAFKLRTLLVAEFRRIALSDPRLQRLLPADWIGDRARRLAGDIYAATIAARSDTFLLATADPKLDTVVTTSDRFWAGRCERSWADSPGSLTQLMRRSRRRSGRCGSRSCANT